MDQAWAVGAAASQVQQFRPGFRQRPGRPGQTTTTAHWQHSSCSITGHRANGFALPSRPATIAGHRHHLPAGPAAARHFWLPIVISSRHYNCRVSIQQFAVAGCVGGQRQFAGIGVYNRRAIAAGRWLQRSPGARLLRWRPDQFSFRPPQLIINGPGSGQFARLC